MMISITNKLIKSKAFFLAVLLCVGLCLFGCSVKKSNDSSTINKEEKLYSVQFQFKNLDCLREAEKDLMVVYSRDGNVYSGGTIAEFEKNYEIFVPVQDFMISSKILGHHEVHVEEGETVWVFVDYLEKTIEIITNGK